MAVFTFICNQDGDSWSAKQHAGEHNLEASADSAFDLQRQLTKLALGTGSSGAVSSSFSYVTPSSAVYQVIIGGGGGGFFAGGGAGAAAAAPAAGGAAPAAEEKKEEPKKEEEESDDDMGFSLFD